LWKTILISQNRESGRNRSLLPINFMGKKEMAGDVLVAPPPKELSTRWKTAKVRSFLKNLSKQENSGQRKRTSGKPEALNKMDPKVRRSRSQQLRSEETHKKATRLRPCRPGGEASSSLAGERPGSRHESAGLKK